MNIRVKKKILRLFIPIFKIIGLKDYLDYIVDNDNKQIDDLWEAINELKGRERVSCFHKVQTDSIPYHGGSKSSFKNHFYSYPPPLMNTFPFTLLGPPRDSPPEE